MTRVNCCKSGGTKAKSCLQTMLCLAELVFFNKTQDARAGLVLLLHVV
jgi:hypothetical protein